MNVSIESLKKIHGDKASEVFAEIAQLSGAGNVTGSGFNSHSDGIDLTGALDPENKTISAANKAKIQSLLKEEKKEGKN